MEALTTLPEGDMVERVAESIWRQEFANYEREPPCDWAALKATSREDWHALRAQARAAIEAMRVPTVEMVVDATEEWLCIRAQEDRAEVIWEAMINRALGLFPAMPGKAA